MRAEEPQAVRGSAPMLRRACAACAEEAPELRRTSARAVADGAAAPPIVDAVLRSPGRSLDPATRDLMAHRFATDFGNVRVHTDARAAESATAVGARAYTVGRDVVFGAGEYAPETSDGRRLIAHELAHVAQQGGDNLRRVPEPPAPGANPTAGTTPTGGKAGSGGAAKKAPACTPPSHCPADFCQPMDQLSARAFRLVSEDILLAGISTFVNPRVVPVWRTYIDGGAATADFTADFGADFTASSRTARVTRSLVSAMKASLKSSPPKIAPGGPAQTIDMDQRLAARRAAINDGANPERMNFNTIGEIPGNLAGDIGKNEASCPVGATPSTIDDSRSVHLEVEVERTAPRVLTCTPTVTFHVEDTVDLCPGDCGAPMEQIATVPLSQMEASGISGDVPFTVDFPGPDTELAPFTI